ncbi:cache domain-containing protein [Undibacterium sp. Jales W-56]|uniref:cache domain-containing protein n=1 Tax=Undibacterium sp. Jales W-56 TaxID=2897325 RepID=UPI0021CFC4C9|nr:cache domain-containing protein [Undibacterium sp. Jales W-56]MCU6433546.1 cache domain-containing protein [Undibacterium sp. Jales W-56]
MKILNRFVMCCALSLGLLSGTSAAEDRGTTDQAIAMVKKAIATIKSQGKDKAFAEFANTSNKEFHDRDLYIIVYDLNGLNLSHGNNPKMMGKNLIDLKAGDKFVIREMIAIIKTKGSGWVDYQWPNPMTKVLENKSTYVEKVDDYFVGCGIYK